ncbi:hypothetical protein V495_08635 [Pseudogymnoascus sp. VKM F-4514 (FW-929)]|nr:hypothetical protein V495_08635 [Pseudogymnoascus sp. VKM F-4514 (FW-929)]KFY60570.1 hypothetical protein V497_03550 [Pseudogymnoascus sp. VKM F-4516 (FW-969)]
MALTRRDTLITAGEGLTGYTFSNDELLWEAVQAPGSNTAFLYPEGNKRLAMIGGAVLKLTVLDDLRPRNMTIGAMHNAAESIVNTTGLERVGRLLNIDEIVNRNPSQQGSVSPRTITDTVQAILGAVYLDSGRSIDSVRLVMANLGLWGPESEQLALL